MHNAITKWDHSTARAKQDSLEMEKIAQVISTLRSCQPLFTKLAEYHISAQFFVTVFVLGWYKYFETAQVLFSLCFRENGVKTLKIYE